MPPVTSSATLTSPTERDGLSSLVIVTNPVESLMLAPEDTLLSVTVNVSSSSSVLSSVIVTVKVSAELCPLVNVRVPLAAV